MSNHEEFLEALHASRADTTQTLETVVEWARNAVTGTEAGILLRGAKGKLETAAPTSPTVTKAHDMQIQFNEGPCLDVMKDGNPDRYVVGDTASDRRFLVWGPAVTDLGIRSAIGVALATTEERLGSLNVYASDPHRFDRDDLETVDVFSRRAARAIIIAREQAGLTVALDTRKLIGQAQGILMERYGIDADRAFDYLARRSQAENVKLRTVAEEVVTTRKAGD